VTNTLTVTGHKAAQADMLKPINDYDPAWIEYNELHPFELRSVGAEASDDAGDDGDGDSNDDDAGNGDDDGDSNDDGDSGDDAGGDDWRSSIEDSKARKHAEQFASPADAAKSAYDMRAKLSNAVNIPGKDASDEDRAAFNEKMGVPKESKDYEFALPEGTELTDEQKTEFDELKVMFHKHNMSADQAAGFFADLNERSIANTETSEKAIEEGVKTAEADLRKEWGDDYTTNKNHFDRAIKTFGGDEFAHMMENVEVNGVKLGNTPAMMRAWASVGRKIDESTMDLTLSEVGKADLDTKIDELTDKLHSEADVKKRQEFFDERAELSSRLHGDDDYVR